MTAARRAFLRGQSLAKRSAAAQRRRRMLLRWRSFSSAEICFVWIASTSMGLGPEFDEAAALEEDEM